MGQRSDTAGYSDRLAEALVRGPRPMSVRALAQVVRGKYPDLPGTSYGGVRQYAEGNIQKPRPELLRAIADILEVRWEWLVFGEGGMTTEKQKVLSVAATMTGTATAIKIGKLFKLSGAGPTPDDIKRALGAVQYAVVMTLKVPVSAAVSRWTDGLVEVWDRMARSSEDGEKTDAQPIADALLAPLEAFGVDPTRMRESKALDDYIFAMTPILLAVVAEKQRQDDG